MNNIKLKDRVGSYRDIYDHKFMNRIPLILCVNGRSFQKTTSLLNKPYCDDFATCMLSTMSYLCTQIDGVVFAYLHNDEMCFVLRNDQNDQTQPWCDNKIQKITSIASSLATLHFNQAASAGELNLLNDNVFYCQAFNVPSLQEAVNTIVFKQQSNFHLSVQFACFYELLKKYNQHSIREMLSGLTLDEKKDLLSEECNIDFNDYPALFKKGAACYKIPKIIDGNIKNKWCVNKEIPTFSKDQNFLNNILKTGHDLFRSDD